MFIKAILRPHNLPSTYLGPATLGLKWMSYVPAGQPMPAEMLQQWQQVQKQQLLWLSQQRGGQTAGGRPAAADGKAAASRPPTPPSSKLPHHREHPPADAPPPPHAAGSPLPPRAAPPPPAPNPPWVTIVLDPPNLDAAPSAVSLDLAASGAMPLLDSDSGEEFFPPFDESSADESSDEAIIRQPAAGKRHPTAGTGVGAGVQPGAAEPGSVPSGQTGGTSPPGLGSKGLAVPASPSPSAGELPLPPPALLPPPQPEPVPLPAPPMPPTPPSRPPGASSSSSLAAAVLAAVEATGLAPQLEALSEAQLFCGGLFLVLGPCLAWLLLRRCGGRRRRSRGRLAGGGRGKGGRRGGRARDEAEEEEEEAMACARGVAWRGVPALRAAPDDAFVIDEEEEKVGTMLRLGCVDAGRSRSARTVDDLRAGVTGLGYSRAVPWCAAAPAPRKPRGLLSIIRDGSGSEGEEGARHGMPPAGLSQLAPVRGCGDPVAGAPGQGGLPPRFVSIEYVGYPGGAPRSVATELPASSLASVPALARFLLDRGVRSGQLGGAPSLSQVRLQLPTAAGASHAPPLKRISQIALAGGVVRCVIEPREQGRGRSHEAGQATATQTGRRAGRPPHPPPKKSVRRERRVGGGARFQSVAAHDSSSDEAD